MHEYSLAEAILSAVLDLAKKNAAEEVLEVVVEVGELRLVNVDILKFAFGALSKGTPAENAELVVKTSPAVLKCKACGHKWRISPEDVPEAQRLALHLYGDLFVNALQCERCGSINYEVLQGREIRLVRVKVRKREDQGSGN